SPPCVSIGRRRRRGARYPPPMPEGGFERILEHNERFVAAFDRSALTAAPLTGMAILTCMDARIDVEDALGLRVGDAHIIRNAGGLASNDAIRSLVVSQQLLGTREITVIAHTRCGLHGADEAALRRQIEDSTGGATRAGVEPGFIDRLCELAILTAEADAFSEGDIRRARILQALVASGMPVEAIGEGVRAGVVHLAFELFTGLTDETFEQASERTGVPFEVLSAMREAAGSAPPQPGDRVRILELEALPALELQVANGMRPQGLERLLRAWGDSLRRMAEVEADLWASDILGPIFAAGGGFGDVGALSADFSNALQPLSARQMIALYRGQQSVAWMRNFFEGFEAGLASAGLYKPIDRPPA